MTRNPSHRAFALQIVDPISVYAVGELYIYTDSHIMPRRHNDTHQTMINSPVHMRRNAYRGGWAAKKRQARFRDASSKPERTSSRLSCHSRPKVLHRKNRLHERRVMLLMIAILHDLIYQNPGNNCSRVFLRSCRMSIIKSILHASMPTNSPRP